LVTSIHLPNGNPQAGPKFEYKLVWFERLIVEAEALIRTGVPVVLAGDYKVVPTPQDVYPTKSLDNDALIQPASRAAFARLLGQGWTDALRRLQPEGRCGHSGTMNAAGGPPTKGCAWTTCSFPRA
jgi:exodeoxyribonuclease-3